MNKLNEQVAGKNINKEAKNDMEKTNFVDLSSIENQVKGNGKALIVLDHENVPVRLMYLGSKERQKEGVYSEADMLNFKFLGEEKENTLNILPFGGECHYGRVSGMKFTFRKEKSFERYYATDFNEQSKTSPKHETILKKGANQVIKKGWKLLLISQMKKIVACYNIPDIDVRENEIHIQDVFLQHSFEISDAYNRGYELIYGYGSLHQGMGEFIPVLDCFSQIKKQVKDKDFYMRRDGKVKIQTLIIYTECHEGVYYGGTKSHLISDYWMSKECGIYDSFYQTKVSNVSRRRSELFLA